MLNRIKMAVGTMLIASILALPVSAAAQELTLRAVEQTQHDIEVVYSVARQLSLIFDSTYRDDQEAPVLGLAMDIDPSNPYANATITCTGSKICVDGAENLQAKGCACSSIEGGTSCDCPTKD